MLLVYLAFGVILFSVGAVVAALRIMARNRKAGAPPSVQEGRTAQIGKADGVGGTGEGPYRRLPPLFFIKDTTRAGKIVRFYADAPFLGVSIPSHGAVRVDFDEIAVFLSAVGAVPGEMFFVLQDDEGRILQFSRDNGQRFMDADLPVVGGSFVGRAQDAEAAKGMVWHFLNGYDVVAESGLVFQEG